MGSELVGESTSQQIEGSSNTTLLSYTQVFEEHCPFYMSIGMTYDDYWNGDCMLTKTYLKAYQLKQERDLKNRNQELWLQGFYFYTALCQVSPVLHAFAKSGAKPIPYLEKPIPITQEEQKERDIEERNERLKAFREQLINSAKNV